MNLQEQKQALVAELNKINQKIDDYWLLDIAYDSWPLKDFLIRKREIEFRIKEINKEIEKQTLSI